MIHRRIRITQAFVSIVMHVLDEHFHFAVRGMLLDRSARGFFACDFVSRQRFLQDCHQRAVGGQEHAVHVIVFVEVFGRDVQSDQRLTRSRHACNEANDFVGVCAGIRDEVADSVCRAVQFSAPGVASRDFRDRVAVVQRRRSFDDRWSWTISALFPSARVDRRLVTDKLQNGS